MSTRELDEIEYGNQLLLKPENRKNWNQPFSRRLGGRTGRHLWEAAKGEKWRMFFFILKIKVDFYLKRTYFVKRYFTTVNFKGDIKFFWRFGAVNSSLPCSPGYWEPHEPALKSHNKIMSEADFNGKEIQDVIYSSPQMLHLNALSLNGGTVYRMSHGYPWI